MPGDGSAGSSPVSVDRSGRGVECRALRNGRVPEEFVAGGNEYLEIITGNVHEWLDEGEPEGSIGYWYLTDQSQGELQCISGRQA